MLPSSKDIRKSTSYLIKSALAIAILATPAFAANDTNYTYLALGESIAFGFNPTLFAPGLPTPTPSQFIGYPEVIAQFVPQYKKVANAACPGETSGSFLNGVPPADNGCNSTTFQGPPFKTSIGLHVSYTDETQIAFATQLLASDKHISLVTLSIGGNDLLLVAQQCTPGPSFATCVGVLLPPVIAQYGANLATILAKIRQNYSGTLVLVNNYAPNTDPTYIGAIAFLDSVTAKVGLGFGAKIADAFTAFQIASAFHAGDPCAAGLLIRLSPTTCDVHPTLEGQTVIAATVLATINPFNLHK
jgi:lysophospholipase L1-like esterase